MANIFHIIEKGNWDLARKQGSYSPESLGQEGFIHCSRPDQLVQVANSFYKGNKGLLLLRIIEENVLSKLVWEAPLEAPNSGVIFPHIYGELNLDSVDKVFDFPCDNEGHFQLPKGLLK